MQQEVSVHKLLRLMVGHNRNSRNATQLEAEALFKELWTDPHAHELLGDYLQRPGCGGCIDKLAKLISSDSARVQSLVRLLDPSGEKTRAVSVQARRREPVVGVIRDIHDTEESFRDLMTEMYRRSSKLNIAIRPLDGGMIRVYFY